jgi:tetratricopeptide (TPR) repeat protein
MEIDNKLASVVYDIDQIGKKGKLQEALDQALQAIRQGLYEDDLFFIAADLAYQLGDLDKAAQLINRLLARDPEHVNGWILFGQIHEQRQDIARASYGRLRAENLFPGLREIDFDGQAVEERAPSANETGLETPSDRRIDFDTLTFAEICAEQGYYNKALKIYYDLLEKDPQNEDLRRRIDELNRRLNKND